MCREMYLKELSMREKIPAIISAIENDLKTKNRVIISDIFVCTLKAKVPVYFVNYELSSPYANVREYLTEEMVLKRYNV